MSPSYRTTDPHPKTLPVIPAAATMPNLQSANEITKKRKQKKQTIKNTQLKTKDEKYFHLWIESDFNVCLWQQLLSAARKCISQPEIFPRTITISEMNFKRKLFQLFHCKEYFNTLEFYYLDGSLFDGSLKLNWSAGARPRRAVPNVD